MSQQTIKSIMQEVSPNVVRNHQEQNAREFENKNAAELILEKDLTGEKLYQEIERIMQNSELRYQMQNTSKQLGIPDAAQRMITVMNEIIEKK